jgi:hypothetical protein
VHCTWRTDLEGDALIEQRDMHELMHPGGTVLVGALVDEIMADVEEVLAKPKALATNGIWPKDKIVAALQAWEREHGSIPTTKDWEHANDGAWPSAYITKVRFGSWGDAIVAAGFPKPSRGGRRRSLSVPPPVAEPQGHAGGHKESPIARNSAPAQASQGTAEGTLAELGQHVDEISSKRSQVLAELDRLERELAQAVAALRSALEPFDLESAS